MTNRLPPLNSLRAFESAARHRSFSRAAEELAVTPAAISHQIKGLEEYLGAPLFRRAHRTLMLTEAGQSLLPGVRKAFTAFHEAMENFRAYDEKGLLTIALPPAFAANWLLHRLEHFNRAHPEVDVRISSNVDLVDYERGGVDIGVRYGNGEYEGLIAERLLTDSVLPVCSPRLLANGSALKTPNDLANFTLLHDESHRSDPSFPNWTMWLKAAGADDVDSSHGVRFDTASASQTAAIEGVGVALGRTPLVADDLDAGRLVCPFDVVLPSSFAYYIVYPPANIKRPKVALFRDWLMDEASQSRAKAA